MSWQQFSALLEDEGFRVARVTRHLGGGIAVHEARRLWSPAAIGAATDDWTCTIQCARFDVHEFDAYDSMPHDSGM
jgi:hypothetical protein